MGSQKKYILIGLVILVGLISALVISKKVKTANLSTTQAPTAQVPLEANVGMEKVKGPANAPINIVEFSDFQCPSCKAAEPAIKDLFEQFPGLIQLNFKNFPLPMHQFALFAAGASECANEQGKFWEYHDLLFEQQETWANDPETPTLFFAYANSLGIDRNQFQACLQNQATVARVQADREQGRRMEISSTPTFFINGERVVGSKQLADKGPEIIRTKLETLVGNKKS